MTLSTEFSHLVGQLGIEWQTESIGGIQGLVARIEVNRPYALPTKYRKEFRQIDSSIFVGRTKPEEPTTIAAILEEIRSGEYPRRLESWEEIWVIPSHRGTVLVPIMPSMGFPDGLRESARSMSDQTMKLSEAFVRKIAQNHHLDLVFAKESLCIFELAEQQPFKEALSIAKAAVDFSSQYFEMGPDPEYVAQAWAKEGLFGIGCA